jgi:hypothetical protein
MDSGRTQLTSLLILHHASAIAKVHQHPIAYLLGQLGRVVNPVKLVVDTPNSSGRSSKPLGLIRRSRKIVIILDPMGPCMTHPIRIPPNHSLW